ncbi:ABC transporter ATP-binding protein [Diaminobutyricimonas sp. LJ205]|uniref:ABC transporter ATP-binding protein n=1 Tax=Diaminobutyricimonas sp. LJ205 TaxID=2683590 RepID=UPI0012F4CDC9|nr:ABC transporter ATP-binding protein [Diaminobutyricimonas sp. LJ205]
MPSGVSIEFKGVSKRFGQVDAVSDLSFTVQPGRVTGFLGPNGAGKTTTMRMLLGLVRPTAGTATFAGTAYANLDRPLETVGTALEAASFHPGRTARNHLAIYARAAGIPRTRVDETLALVGLADFADRRVGGYSLGMRQRLGLAFALLGDPGVLVLDEPINGLDPEGIRWIRVLLRQLASEGRTVLVSSHLLSEVQQTVDEVVIIAKGRFVYQGALTELERGTRVVTDALDRKGLRDVLAAAGAQVIDGDSGLIVSGLSAAEVGLAALGAGIALTLLTPESGGLENIFLDLVGEGAGA